ncbi:hypothetical protein BXZ70DRAFT_768707 [Cristinia sonorae]|uniref:Neutral metalloproteinase n=1 Tax=Cristinia sonorae TaxID=1940300 RepID=A0A8K0XSI1_9AGAR|nr:hypothetical protein BXZ70DRAFT_768707 [Cristinia sonorae]
MYHLRSQVVINQHDGSTHSQASSQGTSHGHGSAGIVPSSISTNIANSKSSTSSSASIINPVPIRLNRRVWSANNTRYWDGKIVRSEGEPKTADVVANECYDGFGDTFTFFLDVFGRNSIDGYGETLVGSVHYDQNWGNAIWDGARVLFGDGQIFRFNRLTIALDVIGHELTHAVTQHTSKLVYESLSGALNESMSDVFGIMVKQYRLKETAKDSNWLIGEGLLAKEVKGTALRSMKEPGTAYDDPIWKKDPQVSHYSQVVKSPPPYTKDNDFGGVHIYSGVPNRAFYLVAINLGGNSWDRAGRIWWAVLSGDQLQPTANFHDFAKLTCSQAERIYGTAVKTVVEHAWTVVGIDVGTKPRPKRSTVTGVWKGTRSGAPCECTFTVSGTTLSGRGTTTVNNSISSFTVTNGRILANGSISFTANYPEHSNEEFRGNVSKSGDSITGNWENSDRQEYLKAGWTDSHILYGTFHLRRQ